EPRNNHIKLQNTHSAHYKVVVFHGLEYLHSALLGQLDQTLLQLLGLQRIFQANPAEQLRREVRNTGELHILTSSEGISELYGAVVVQTDDVTGERLFCVLPIPSHKRQRIRKTHVFRDTNVTGFHALVVAAGHNSDKSNPVPVLRIHICLDFEDKARKT